MALSLFLTMLSPLAIGAPPQAALQSLCDPAKIATLTSDRAANPRIRKIAYWLEAARQQGRDPKAEMDAAMAAVGWGGTLIHRNSALVAFPKTEPG